MNQNGAPPPPPPPPPPHGSNPKSSSGSSGLPNGNYDIFIIPPHSAGGGFLYLPSLQPQRNSFIAGVVSTLAVVYAWCLISPIIKAWVQSVSQSGSGFGMLVLALVVGFGGWVYGKTNPEPGSPSPDGASPDGSSANRNGYARGPDGTTPGAGRSPPPPPNWGRHDAHNTERSGFDRQGHAGAGPGFASQHQHSDTPQPDAQEEAASPPDDEPGTQQTPHHNAPPQPPPSAGQSAWERAREETKHKEEARRRAEAAKADEERKRKEVEEEDKRKRAEEQKKKWEQQRVRERESREREAREKAAREKLEQTRAENAAKEAKEKAERDSRLKAAQERAEKLRAERAATENGSSQRAKSERGAPTFGVGERLNPYSRDPLSAASKSNIGTSPRNPPQPTAQSYAGTATDTAFRPYDAPKQPKHATSNSSFASGSSYAPSVSTAPTSPPQSYTGPYSTSDPQKIIIHGAFKFSDSFPNAPSASVRPNDANISDGLIMRLTTEGVFLDDDRRGDALRQWDIKAWTLVEIETTTKGNVFILRAHVRSVDNMKHVYIVPRTEQWKVAEGLKRLKGGSLLRSSCGMNTLKSSEADRLLGMVGAF